jgi:hypothetical protein
VVSFVFKVYQTVLLFRHQDEQQEIYLFPLMKGLPVVIIKKKLLFDVVNGSIRLITILPSCSKIVLR